MLVCAGFSSRERSAKQERSTRGRAEQKEGSFNNRRKKKRDLREAGGE